MTTSAAHIRREKDAQESFRDALLLYREIQRKGLAVKEPRSLIAAIQAEHLALSRRRLSQGPHRPAHPWRRLAGLLPGPERARHPDPSGCVLDPTGKPVAFKPENQELRHKILRIQYDEASPDLFQSRVVACRTVSNERKSFEPAWQDYREGKIARRKVKGEI